MGTANESAIIRASFHQRLHYKPRFAFCQLYLSFFRVYFSFCQVSLPFERKKEKNGMNRSSYA